MKLRNILLTMLMAVLLVALAPAQAFADTITPPAGPAGSVPYTLDQLFGVDHKLPLPASANPPDVMVLGNGVSLHIGSLETLTIEPGNTLTMLDGAEIISHGVINNSGSISIAGPIRGSGVLVNGAGGTVTASGSFARIRGRVENSGSFVGAFGMGDGTNNGIMDNVTVISSTVLLNYGTIDTASAQVNAGIYNRGIINNVSGSVFCAGLLSMELSSGTLEPGFTTGHTTYSATTDAESVTITGVPCNFASGTTRMDTRNDRVSTGWESAARFEPSGFSSQSIPLEMGTNNIDLWLIGSGGIPYPPYTITITRVEPEAPANAVPHTGSDRQTPLMATLALLSGAVLAYGVVKRKKSA